MLRFILLTLVVLLFVPGIVFALMFICMVNGMQIVVQNWINAAIALSIAAELYGIVKLI